MYLVTESANKKITLACAVAKYSINNTEAIMSVFSIKTWTNKGYSEEEAKYQIAIRRPNNVLYYINKGYSEEEAQRMVKERQAKGGAKRKAMTAAEKRALTPRCVEFYLAKGMTLEQAQDAVTQHQTTFSKEKCIERYGEVEGLRVFNERQERWQETLNSKTQEEKDDINKRKNRWARLDEEQYKAAVEHTRKKSLEMWDNFTQEDIEARSDKIRERMLQDGRMIDPSLLTEWDAYKREVWYYTNKNDLTLLENFSKRARDGYHVDHKYSIWQGFVDKVDASVIGHIANLEMLHYVDNISKHTDCSITLDELLHLTKAANA